MARDVGPGCGWWAIVMGSCSGGAVADELGEVVDGADQGPFLLDLVEAAQAEPPEAAGGLDLAEDRLDDLLAQAVARAPAGAPELGVHAGHQAAGRDPSAAGVAGLVVAGAAGHEVAGDAAGLQGGQVGLVAEAGVGRDLLGLAPAPPGGVVDQWRQGAVVGAVG